jgi:hypothetical protein
MKRCPTCNQTFSEGWLSFCTQDGTTLIEDSASRSEPPPTIMAPLPPPQTSPNQPANWTAPSGGFGSGPFSQPQPMQAGWQPPPPPTYATPKQGLAITSLCLGIFSITFGWCCSIGLLSSVAAIVFGGISLTQIKNNPDQNTGKPLALVGIILASLYLLVWVLIMVLWGFGAMMGGFK